MLKFFQKYIKCHGQGHIFKIYGTIAKALWYKEIHIQNIKALSFRMKKVMANVKVFKSRSKVTVKVMIYDIAWKVLS